MATTADSLLKTNQISAMIKQGFLITPPPNSPIPTTLISHPSPSASSRTLFQMITQESTPTLSPTPSSIPPNTKTVNTHLGEKPRWGPSDVELLITGGGVRVSMEVHGKVLGEKSGFFKKKLRNHNCNGGRVVEIRDCDDVEVYVDVVGLMYCDEDLKKRLLGLDVSRVLALLKVSSAITFNDGVMACLDYLDSIPWSENQEDEILAALNQLHLNESNTNILQRVSVESSTSSKSDSIFSQLLSNVLQAKDDKARKEMKVLLFNLIADDNNISIETFYRLCHRCLETLHLSMSEAAIIDDSIRDRATLMAKIARESDNLHWLMEILIHKKMADDFVMLWADQTQLSILHSKIPCMYRFEISRITVQLCVAIGKGDVLVSKIVRYSLLRTWLDAFYSDFSWMKRACRDFDKDAVEDGFCKTILTLPMEQQKAILTRWLDLYLKKGDDCPNFQRAFQVWWMRFFVKRKDSTRDGDIQEIDITPFEDGILND